MGEFISNNPALFYSLTIGLAAAIISVVVAFGVPASPELIAAIDGLVVMVASTVIGFVTRGKVVPFKNVLEYRLINPDGTTSDNVVAGPANDMIKTGEGIRPVQPSQNVEPTYERH